jgi:hypothetical protein
LFTDLPTGSDTTEEHTIPRVVAGRFRSRTASASEFNNECSGPLDAPLGETYALLVNVLAPLLSAEHQPGSIAIAGAPADGRIVLAPGGVGRLRGTRIDARDESGRPTAWSAEGPGELQRVARQLGFSVEQLDEVTVRPIASGYVRRRQPILSPIVEVALLKSALLTFDHLLGSGSDSFTRAPALHALRQAIVGVVRGDDPVSLVGATSWGIDYEGVEAFKAFVDQHRPRPRSEFEHVLLISIQDSGPADLFFLVAGVDLYRFRLCDRWPGRQLHLLCGAGMLAGDAPYGPIVVSMGPTFGQPTQIRSVFPQTATRDEVAAVCRTIGDRRRDAVRRAYALVETLADAFVHTQIIELETTGSTTLGAAVTQRLVFMYDGVVSGGQRDEFLRLIADQLRLFPDGVLDVRASELPPQQWLRHYRGVFEHVVREFGLPGRIFEIEAEAAPEAAR